MEVLILTRGNADKQNLHIIQINYSPFGGFCFTYDQCVGLYIYIFFIFPFVPIYISLKNFISPSLLAIKKLESIKMFIPFPIFSNACIWLTRVNEGKNIFEGSFDVYALVYFNLSYCVYTTFLTLYIMIERPHGNIVFYDEINNNQKICAEINFLF